MTRGEKVKEILNAKQSWIKKILLREKKIYALIKEIFNANFYTVS